MLVFGFFRPPKLSQKLLRVVFSIYLIVTVTITIAISVTEYIRTKSAVTNDIQRIAEIVNPSISRSLWQYDYNQVRILSDGVLKMPGVEGIDILDANQQKILSERQFDDGSAPASLFYNTSELTWNTNTNRILMGELRVYSSSRVIFNRIAAAMVSTILATILKISILFFLFVWAFHKYLARPITDLAQQVRSIDWTTDFGKRIKMKQVEDNELYQLQEDINGLLTKIERDQISKQKDAISRQKWLEKAVQERTMELTAMNKKLEDLAAKDPLTDVLNRRSFYKAVGASFSALQQAGRTSCFMMIDLDHFKYINDTYGHFVGDQVLIDFCQKIRNTFRDTDLVGRIGGEEFAIFLPDIKLSIGLDLANVLREVVDQSVRQIDGHEVRYTISVGVASSSTQLSTMDHLSKAADAKLYEAKRKGRDRVES